MIRRQNDPRIEGDGDLDRFAGRRSFTVGDVIRRLVDTGHNRVLDRETGDIFGAPAQAFWFVASVCLAVQAVTGALIWWNGRS